MVVLKAQRRFSLYDMQRVGKRIQKSQTRRSMVLLSLTVLVVFQIVTYPSKLSNRKLIVSKEIEQHKSHGTIVAVINTPKMGTGGLFLTFRKSWRCVDAPSAGGEIFAANCRDDRHVFRTHVVDSGVKQIQQHREDHPEGQCLVVTAMRNPASWFGSLFLQGGQRNWKDEKQMLQNYKLFLKKPHLVNSIHSVFPSLFKEFGVESLTEQARIMEMNGGYSFVGPAPPESRVAGCNLLFMNMEQSELWPSIFKKVDPSIKFERGISRKKQNPDHLNEIDTIENYELSTEERMAIHSRGGPLMNDWFKAYKYSLTSDEQMRSLFGIAPGSVVAVMNTAKMGTGGLQTTFGGSFGCKGGFPLQRIANYDCNDDRKVFRTHFFEAGVKEIQWHREYHPEGQCLIVSAIRSPESWFGSMFLQRAKQNWKAPEEMLIDYKKFLGSNSMFEMLTAVLPNLLKEFNAGTLVDQARIMDSNNGYSLIGPAPTDSAVAGCNLMLLRLEQSENWADIVQRIDPNVKVRRGTSRLQQHPSNTEQINAIANYKLTSEERMSIYKRGGPFVEDWFEAYGYNLKAEDKLETFTNPGTVIAIMNTARMATGSLFIAFRNSWSCSAVPPVDAVRSLNCDNNRLVFRTHWFDAGVKQIQNHRKDHSEGQCLIVAAIRSPETWFASIFLQMNTVWQTDENILDNYRSFISSDNFIPVLLDTLPTILREFNAGPLTTQVKIIDQNAGYSFLGPAPHESSVAGCEGLLLSVEHSHRWKEILEMIDPNIQFESSPSRMETNPMSVDQIKIVADYQLTHEEKKAIYTKGGPFIADWFDAYRYMNNLVAES